MLKRVLFLSQMLRNERRTRAALDARQLRHLQTIVVHARMRVPFYRDLYAERGVRSLEIRSLGDLLSLPIVDKQMLRGAGPDAMSLDAPRDTVTIATSGTSGEPFHFRIDRRYDQWRKAQYLRPYLSTGMRPRDKVLRVTGRPKNRKPWYCHLGLMRQIHLDAGTDPALVVDAWRDFAPDILQGYPSALRALAHYCLERGQPLAPMPRLVYTDSELLLPDTRALLERAFGIAPLDIFGTLETDNIAFQCAASSGYHVTIDSVVLEIVADGQPLPAGGEGEIVVTPLFNRTAPFIRYNLKDIGRLSPDPCPCGRPFPLLSIVSGRSNELALLRDGGRRTPQGIFAKLNNFADSLRQYQLRQTGVGSFDFLFVPAEEFRAADVDRITNALRTTLGESKIALHSVDRIEPDPSGKRRLFVPL